MGLVTVIRMFMSAVSPDDVDAVVEAFTSEVIPAFRAHRDCLSAELIMDVEPGVDGLVAGGALTRWVSEEAMIAALASEELTAAQFRVREYLRREPIRSVYRVVS